MALSLPQIIRLAGLSYKPSVAGPENASSQELKFVEFDEPGVLYAAFRCSEAMGTCAARA